MDSANTWYTVNQKGEAENGKAVQCGVQAGSRTTD